MVIRSIFLTIFSVFLVTTDTIAQGTSPIRVNVSPSGGQASTAFPGTNQYLSSPGISSDGRFVVFDSGAADILPLSSPGYHVFVRDVATGTTELVSKTTAGGEVTGIGGPISQSGRFVLFNSSQVDGSFSFNNQLYLRDRQSGTTTLVSGPPGGGEPNQSWLPAAFRVGALSDDGRYAAFISLAGNLITPNEPTQTTADLFVFDRDTATTRRAVTIDVSSAIDDFALSGNGAVLAFSTDDPNIVAGDTNGSADLFVTDLSSGTTTKAFSHTEGLAVDVRFLSLNTDGRYVAFVTAIPLDVRHVNGSTQAYVYDRNSGTTTLVSSGISGATPDNSAFDVSISADGQLVAVSTTAGNILPGVVGAHVYLRRWQTGETILISASASGEPGNSASTRVTLSSGGDFASFLSFGTNLVSGDTNGDADYFRVNADSCPADAAKLSPGQCGCGVADVDANANGLIDCIENDVQPLTPKTRLNNPPGVTVSGRSATVFLQKFSKASLDSSILKFFARARAKKKLSIQYQITLVRTGAPKRDRIQRVTKKSQETFRKLTPGQYTVSYQAFGVQGTKRVIKTNISPRTTFEIR